MFIHAVLFEVKPKELAFYRKDSLMWARCAKKAGGFLGYSTLQRLGHRHQYVSAYEWREKAGHDRFMKKYHDWLMGRSKAKVKVLGYYNLQGIDRLKK
ncbi:MAG: hypothetical protein Q8N85_01835 [Candidatus Omnitrophota bacterium]|nr:hypothetical protein [Candidatus Omnitrophota bacterium]